MSDNKNMKLFEPQNVEAIAEMGPKAATENKLSHSRCIAAGEQLINRVKDSGMTDELDQEIASYIKKASKTVKVMNEKRTPVTKIFDIIRSNFTALESEVNPATKNSIPYQLQEYRNQYAAKKREEMLRKQQEEAARQARINAIQVYRTEVERDFNAQLNNHIVGIINSMTSYLDALTIENYDFTKKEIENVSSELSDTWISSLKAAVRIPSALNVADCRTIEDEVKKSVIDRYKEQYTFEVGDYRADLIDRLPSKKSELERIAKSNAEEAARLKAEMEARERENAARKEQERLEAEAKAKAEAEMQAKKNEMENLFGAAKMQTAVAYQPKAQVKKRIEVLNPEGFMDVIGLWWSQVGCTMTVEELSKVFSKQITFCNKVANEKDNEILIKSEHINYVDDVKAK